MRNSTPICNGIIFIFLILFIVSSQAVMAADGDLDTTFGNHKVITAIGSSDEVAKGVAVQVDGRVIAAGFSDIGGQNCFAVTRYDTNGSIDVTFGGGDGIVTTSIGSDDSQAMDFALQADGKIVVVGYTLVGTNWDFAVVRYTSNGTLDTTFGGGDGIVITPISSSYHDKAQGVAIQSDGKIVVVGGSGSSAHGGTDDFAMARYDSSGELDLTFGGGDGIVITDFGYVQANAVTIQSNGKIILAGGSFSSSTSWDFALARYDSDGSLDDTFRGDGIVITPISTTSDQACSVATQDDGKIVLVGYSYNTTYSESYFTLARYDSSGNLDATFGGGDGIVITSFGGFNNDIAENVVIQDNSKIVVAGSSHNGTDYDFAIARYDSSGTLDESFNGDGKIVAAIGSSQDQASGVALQSDGKIVVAGYSENETDYDFALVRYSSSGNLDAAFGVGEGKLVTPIDSSSSYARGVAIQSDDKIVVAGYTDDGIALVRYDINGNPDQTFGDGDGTVTTPPNAQAYSVAIQNDGKIVVAGYKDNGIGTVYDFAVARYNSSGHLDTTFGGGNGIVTTDIGPSLEGIRHVAIQSNGKIVVAGNSSNNDFVLVRYDDSGNLDTTFGEGNGIVTTPIGSSSDVAYSAVIQSDGKIIVAGASDNGTDTDIALVRYDSSGNLDTSFGGGDGIVTTPIGSSNDEASGVLIQSDGKIVVAGHSFNGSGNWDFAVVRYASNGDIDTTFGGGDGIVTTPIGSSHDYAQSIAIDCDDNIIVVGRIDIGGDNWDFAVVRYASSGDIDTTFGGGDGIVTTPIGSTYDHAFSVALQRDGKIVVAGYSYNNNDLFDFAVARYIGSVPPNVLGDISGDGIADLSDVILGLQCLTGQSPPLSPILIRAADIDGDQRLSISEVIYALRTVAGLEL